MYINKAALKLYNVTEEDYVNWCKSKNKASYKTSVKEDFFWRLRTGRLVKDSSGKLIVKKPRRK